jgi:hypothetical protein
LNVSIVGIGVTSSARCCMSVPNEKRTTDAQ